MTDVHSTPEAIAPFEPFIDTRETARCFAFTQRRFKKWRGKARFLAG
jgi:hypothetical protein